VFVRATALCVIGVLLFFISGCGEEGQSKGGKEKKKEKPPERIEIDTDGEKYRKASVAFRVGVAAPRANRSRMGVQKLKQVTELVPDEPAAWANLGVSALRKRQYELASKRLQKAAELAPGTGSITYLQGLLHRQKGNIDKAIETFRTASEQAPENVRIQYALVRELRRRGLDQHGKQIQRRLEIILQKDEGNLPALVELVRIAAHNRDRTTVRETLSKLSERSNQWPEPVRSSFQSFREAAADPEKSGRLSAKSAFFENALQELHAYRRDRRSIESGTGHRAALITNVLRLPDPEPQIASADTDLSFEFNRPPGIQEQPDFLWTVSLEGKLNTSLLWLRNNQLHVGQENRYATDAGIRTQDGLAALDLNYDFRMDLLLAGSGGLSLLQQQEDGTFKDVTPSMAVSDEIRSGTYRSAHGADLDMDGDLDLFVGGADGAPEVSGPAAESIAGEPGGTVCGRNRDGGARTSNGGDGDGGALDRREWGRLDGSVADPCVGTDYLFSEYR